MAAKPSSLLCFHELTFGGPPIAFAAGCLVGDAFYLHGGVSEARSTKPKKEIYVYNISCKEWSLVNESGPSLSHHACICLDADRVLLFIGGWDGKQRCSDVYLYYCEGNTWRKCETSGFPVGAGLSSHTANILSHGNILIIGREGSLRMQRRSGNAFVLTGSATKGRFVYQEMALSVASRSGHTTNCQKGTAVIIGGRSDKLVELHHLAGACSSNKPSLSTLTSTDSLPIMSKLPCGRKHHTATEMGDHIVVFGGETFDGRSKEPVSDVYLIDSSKNYTWKHAGKAQVGRAGHLAVYTDGGLLIHGGVGERNCVSSLTFMLKFS